MNTFTYATLAENKPKLISLCDTNDLLYIDVNHRSIFRLDCTYGLRLKISEPPSCHSFDIRFLQYNRNIYSAL